MNDCTNAEMRDLLPDLLHERLDASARATVLAHVNLCVDCRDELTLLREIRDMATVRARPVNVAAIVSALPKPPAQQTPVIRLDSRRRIWSDWRIAAAVTLLVAGGGSYALVRGTQPGTPVIDRVDTVIASATIAQPTDSTMKLLVKDSPADPSTVATTDADEPASAGGDSRLRDLSDDQLQSLINDINGFRAVPSTESEPVSIRVNVKVGSSDDAGAGT